MIQRDELTNYLYKEIFGGELMAKAAIKDELANGIQFSGSETVSKIALGVSCNEAFLHEAVAWGAQYCIFHHGLDPRTHKSRYPLYAQKRLKLIVQNSLTIAGFHYALDAHPEIGNNAVIIRELGARRGEHLFDEWGYVGSFEKPRLLSDLRQHCEALFDHEIVSFESGPEEIHTIGVVSGGGKPYAAEIAEMEAKEVQLYISGESSESVPHKMLESQINYFVCGHYATEVFGVKALGEKIQQEFNGKLEVQLIDIPNPI